MEDDLRWKTTYDGRQLMMEAVYVVFRAGSRLLVIKMAGSVYSVPVCENVKAGRAEIVEYFVMISIKPGLKTQQKSARSKSLHIYREKQKIFTYNKQGLL